MNISIGVNILLELCVIIGVLTFGYCNNWTEIHTLFKEDIGTIIMMFGAFWAIGVYFRLGKISHSIVSIMIALGLIIFGIVLHQYGLGYALLVSAAYLFYAIIIIGHFSGTIALIFFILSILFVFAGYPMRHITKPTDPKPPTYQTINDPSIQWDLIITTFKLNDGQGESLTTKQCIARITGTEESAYKQAVQKVKEFRAINGCGTFINAKMSVQDVDLVPILPDGYIPKKLQKYMGLSTWGLMCTYTRDESPYWAWGAFNSYIDP